MSRRPYPILGRHKLRSAEVNRMALKPVYLRYRILEGRSEDQSGAVAGTLVLALDLALDLSSDWPWIPVSQILVYN